MLSFKRFLYIILIVASLGAVYLVYSINASKPNGVQVQTDPAIARDFIEAAQLDEEKSIIVRILGDPKDGQYGKIYRNVCRLCKDLQLTVTKDERLEAGEDWACDLVIICDASISRRVDTEELETFIAQGGRIILAAGLAEENGDGSLQPAFGIRTSMAKEDCHALVFEKPLLPVQPEKVYYAGNSGSARLKISEDATVYIRDEKDDIPILCTFDWQMGRICLINGSFLVDIRCAGLLTGAIGALFPDFIYPILGVKAVFLDNLPETTTDIDELCRRVYGYSGEGFVRDVVWPAFQGTSLRTDTPYTASMKASPSDDGVGATGHSLLSVLGGPVLQFGGELVYASECPAEGKIILDATAISQLSAVFPGYTISGLSLTGRIPSEIPEIIGSDIRFVRGSLDSEGSCLAWAEGRTIFPAATTGNAMEDGELFEICSVLGAYGTVSHVFDMTGLIVGDGENDVWDHAKKQIALFESEVLARSPWLEGRTLTKTEDDVRSYQEMEYGWKVSGDSLEIGCTDAVKGQAFFYHTDKSIVGAQGLTYQDAGNGYYLLRMQEGHGVITLEEGDK